MEVTLGDLVIFFVVSSLNLEANAIFGFKSVQSSKLDNLLRTLSFKAGAEA